MRVHHKFIHTLYLHQYLDRAANSQVAELLLRLCMHQSILYLAQQRAFIDNCQFFFQLIDNYYDSLLWSLCAITVVSMSLLLSLHAFLLWSLLPTVVTCSLTDCHYTLPYCCHCAPLLRSLCSFTIAYGHHHCHPMLSY